MKFVAALLFISSVSAHAYDLAGRWENTTDGTLVRFISVSGNYHQHSSQKFTTPYGALAYKIDQTVTFPFTGSSRLEGSVDFFDSRGCSFKGLPVVAEFRDANTVHVLMTVPRYKFSPRSCRVLEYVNVPVELIRF